MVDLISILKALFHVSREMFISEGRLNKAATSVRKIDDRINEKVNKLKIENHLKFETSKKDEQ